MDLRSYRFGTHSLSDLLCPRVGPDDGLVPGDTCLKSGDKNKVFGNSVDYLNRIRDDPVGCTLGKVR